MSKSDEVDYLSVDAPIAGQNFTCVSFISPESVMQERMAFNAVKFIQSHTKDTNFSFDKVYEQYKDFAYKYEDKLQRDFDEKNQFRTSVRGVKVRGVYTTLDEARDCAKKFSLTDSSVHTFIGQVGYWLAWDPNADKVNNEVFANTELNNLMEKYEENTISKDILYEERKREKMADAKQAVLDAKKKQMKEDAADPEPESKIDPESYNPTITGPNKVDPGIIESLDGEDPWLKNKNL